MSQVVYITVESPDRAQGDGNASAQAEWIHPHLMESVHPDKGRQFRVSGPVQKGERLLVDHPYAIIPVVDEPASNDNLLCSNPTCNSRASCPTRVPCPNACIADVVWCGEACRNADTLRHGFECLWLKRYAGPIRAKWGEYDFGMLWLIVRILATRHTHHASPTANCEPQGKEERFKQGWDAIESLCGSQDTWSHEQVKAWSTLVKKYLRSSPILPHGHPTDGILHLICQEEANSFGLYPRETGIFPLPHPPVDRGEQFAAAVYAVAAIANHSCLPNISHKPDVQGRMVFTASRDILPGEECCISYFDLTRFGDLNTRREHLRKSFRFVCRCERCSSEEPVEEAVEWTGMPLMDD
ncbi:SET domain-containing protein [Aspergillus campestris IBT 28561]|uniref:SET domain-containing protein n=1 Tax=Aspergillus campestris (strain IBT 28561) TaxID=1392248 RepID=A0A2I1CRH4_ASPC2|nr:SET domain-containing protein [Aspergillus campestris IBT 28561]PKY00217.1 SET domain-containing protein [Aspergillus campestris IBT 28561]